MTRKATRPLTVKEIRSAKLGDHTDGNGLFLWVRADDSASWTWRYTSPGGRRREMSLGKADRRNDDVCGENMKQVRNQVTKYRAMIVDGVDPLDERNARKQHQQEKDDEERKAKKGEGITLARHARQYHERVVEPKRSSKHSADWINSLEGHVPAELWHAPIASVTPQQLLEALAPLQLNIPETTSRIRQRLEKVFADAEFYGLCKSNPARIVQEKLSERPKRERDEDDPGFAFLPYPEVPAFVRALRLQPGNAARMLEFALLTGSRTGEVIGAKFSEVDTGTSIWTVPAARMKGEKGKRRPHAVYLSPRALQILEQMREQQSAYVFPSPADRAEPLSNMAMLTLVRRMGFGEKTTVHGLCRKSFSTWANECNVSRPDVIEACLAHKEQDRVRAAYNKAQFATERRALLAAWATFCDGGEVTAAPPRATVVAFPQTVEDRKRA